MKAPDAAKRYKAERTIEQWAFPLFHNSGSGFMEMSTSNYGIMLSILVSLYYTIIE